MATNETDDPTLLRSVASVVAGRRRRIVAMSVISFLGAIAEAMVLVLISQVGFALAESKDQLPIDIGPLSATAAVSTGIAAAAALVIVRGLLQVWYGWQSTSLVTDYLADIRMRFGRAFVGASLQEQTSRRVGELQDLLTTFAGRGARTMNEVCRGVVSIFSLVALIGTAIAVSPLASLGLLASIALLGVVLLPFRNVLQASARTAASTDRGFAHAVSEFDGIGKEMQVFGVESRVADQLDDVVRSNARASQRVAFLSFLFTPFYGTVLLLLLVGSLTVVRALGLTDLAQLGAVILVMLRSMAYAQQAQGVFTSLQASAPYLQDLDQRLSSLQNAKVDRSGLEIGSVGSVNAVDVGFEYVAGTPTLQDITFSIERGEIIGVIGPSGSGKSTLVQLMLRLRTPTAGRFEADGVPIDDISLDAWRRVTAFVPQEPRLVHGTVADNIRFFRPEYSEGEIRAAAVRAQVDDEIRQLPDGYSTVVGETGHMLSGGQRQRICIARALVSQPDVLVMDEPTSALDVHSESRIRESISELRGSTTVVIIAHRLTTVETCDRIMVIDSGKLVAFQAPADLRESESFYREALELSENPSAAVRGGRSVFPEGSSEG